MSKLCMLVAVAIGAIFVSAAAPVVENPIAFEFRNLSGLPEGTEWHCEVIWSDTPSGFHSPSMEYGAEPTEISVGGHVSGVCIVGFKADKITQPTNDMEVSVSFDDGRVIALHPSRLMTKSGDTQVVTFALNPPE